LRKGNELIPVATLTEGRVYDDPDAAVRAFRGGLPLLRPDVLKAQTVVAICDILGQVADNMRHPTGRGRYPTVDERGHVVLVDIYGETVWDMSVPPDKQPHLDNLTSATSN